KLRLKDSKVMGTPDPPQTLVTETPNSKFSVGLNPTFRPSKSGCLSRGGPKNPCDVLTKRCPSSCPRNNSAFIRPRIHGNLSGFTVDIRNMFTGSALFE